MKLGILGGTFSPLHYDHLRLAQEAYEQLELDSVLFVPTWKPPYKEGAISFEHRYDMCLRALVGDSRFQVSAIEEQRRVSYSVDMLAALREEYKGAEQYLILGGDQAAQFFTWKLPNTILAMVEEVICLGRSLHQEGRILDHWGEHSEHLYILATEPLVISSSLIRAKVAGGLSLRYWVPPEVEEYIHAESLYVGDGREIEDAATRR